LSLEEREGVVDRLTEKGVVIGGTWFGFSKYLKGPRLTEAHLGHQVTVLFRTYQERCFIDVVKAIGEKVPGWTPKASPPANPKGHSWMGQGRRLSPEELALKRDEGVRIARSVAVDRAIAVLRDGVAVERIAPLAELFEGYLLSGRFSSMGSAAERTLPPAAQALSSASAPAQLPSGDPTRPVPASPSENEERPSASSVSRTRRLDPKAVNALFNEAKLGGLVSDWSGYLTLCRGVLKSGVKSPYALSATDFARVETALRDRLGGSAPRGKVA
jgi:hypothetical protein